MAVASILDYWLGPLQAFSLQTCSGAESLSKFVKEETLVRLEGLREEFLGQAKTLRDRLSRAQRHLTREQEALMKAMREHERLWRQRESGGRIAAEESDKDVWLAELSLHGQVESFLAEKTLFCTSLQEIYTATRVLHADCARRLSSAIAEYFTVKGKQGLAAAELIQDVARGIAAVEPEGEWHAALVRSRLDYEWKLEAPPQDGFTSSVLQQVAAASGTGAAQPVRVLRCGLLMRPGSTFGPAWAPIFCILTDSHFLHGYAPETKKQRRKASAPGSEASPEPAYRVPSVDDQVGARELGDMNMAISRAWLGFLSDSNRTGLQGHLRIDGRLLEPVFSIALREGVTVSIEDGARDDLAWSILVPGGSGFFSRSERKYMFRSWAEEDMVDWCIALKAQIAAAMPVQMATPSSPKATPAWTSPKDQPQSPTAIGNSLEPEHSTNDLPSPFDLDAPVIRVAPAAQTTAASDKPVFNLENPWD